MTLLYDYILHRIYKFDFFSKINVIDKDSYFIPAGYDSSTVLASFDVIGDLGKLYSDRIAPVKSKSAYNEEEISCEETQIFLKRYYGTVPISKISGTTNANYDTNAVTDTSDKKDFKGDFGQFYDKGKPPMEKSVSNQEKIERLKKQEASKLFDNKKPENSDKVYASEELKKRLAKLQAMKK